MMNNNSGDGRSWRVVMTALTLLQLSVALFHCTLSVSVKSPVVSSTTTSTSSSIAARPPSPPLLRPAFSSSPSSAAAVLRNSNKTIVRVDVCALNACEAYVRMRDDLANAVRPINEKLRSDNGVVGDSGVVGDKATLLEARLQRLDRRLRSVEQPGEITTI